MSAHQKLTPQTTTQRTAAHRRRMAEKMARYHQALEMIARTESISGESWASVIAKCALNPTDPAKS